MLIYFGFITSRARIRTDAMGYLWYYCSANNPFPSELNKYDKTIELSNSIIKLIYADYNCYSLHKLN